MIRKLQALNATINLFAPVVIGLAIWTGVTGKVDWWVITLILLSQIELNIKFRD